MINDALNNGRGVFIASLTRIKRGASLQTAIRQAGEYKKPWPTASPAPRAKFNKGNDPQAGSVG